MYNKKSQISLFILIGVIVFILIMIVLYVFVFQKEKVVEQQIPEKAEVPLLAQPIQNYVEECLVQTAMDAFVVLGAHGGYINLSKKGRFANSLQPWNSNAFYFMENIEVPYYIYVEGNDCKNGCTLKVDIPSIDTIEKEIKNFIDEKIYVCLKDFSEFAEKGYSIKELDKAQSIVNIKKGYVDLSLVYNLEIDKDGDKVRISDYFKRMDFNFYEIRELAAAIVMLEKEKNYLERYTLELITSYSDVDKNKLPPIGADTLKPGAPIFWIKSKLKERIKDIIIPYIPILYFVNTTPKYYDFPEEEFSQSFFLMQGMPLNVSFPLYNYEVNFYALSYKDNPIFLDITGRGVKGELIGPEQLDSVIFPFISIKKYNYYYDVSYPVTVEIKNPTAFNNRGYKFLFGMETNLRDNRPVAEGYATVSYENELQETLFCRDEFKMTGDIKIKTVNGETKKPIEEVQVTYQCGSDACTIGYTELVGNEAFVNAKLPSCIGGQLNFKKFGYFGNPVLYDTFDKKNKNEELVVYMYPEKNLRATAKQRGVVPIIPGDYDGNQWALLGEQEFYPNERAIISLQRVKQNPAEEDYSTIIEIINNTYSNITLIPGMYTMDSNLIIVFPTYYGGNRIDKINVMRQKKCVDKGFFGGEECVYINGTLINDTFVAGGNMIGLKFVNRTMPDGNTTYDVEIDTTRLINITPEMLYGSNYIDFVILSYPDLPTAVINNMPLGIKDNMINITYAEFGLSGKKEEFSNRFLNEIKPRLR